MREKHTNIMETSHFVAGICNKVIEEAADTLLAQGY